MSKMSGCFEKELYGAKVQAAIEVNLSYYGFNKLNLLLQFQPFCLEHRRRSCAIEYLNISSVLVYCRHF